MLEVYISLLRNGACVIKNFLPSSHVLLTPPAGIAPAVLPFLHAHLAGIPLIDLFIAPLQLVAVLYGGIGGLFDLVRALQRWRRSKAWARGAMNMESHVYEREVQDMRERLQTEVGEAWGSITWALLKITFGVCFWFFFLSSLKSVEGETMQWTLLAMEVAALMCLYKGGLSLLTRRAKALFLLGITPDDLLEMKDIDERLVEFGDKRLGFTWEDQVSYHPNALFADIEHLSRAYTRLETMIQKATEEHDEDAQADLKEVLHRIHTQGRQQLSLCWLDTGILLMDAIAFLAYIFFPLVWFYPEEDQYHYYLSGSYYTYPGHDFILTTGGIIGDVMWTLQPVCMLASAVIRKVVEEKVVGPEPSHALRLPPLRRRKTTTTTKTAVAGARRRRGGAEVEEEEEEVVGRKGGREGERLTQRKPAAGRRASTAGKESQKEVEKKGSSNSSSSSSGGRHTMGPSTVTRTSARLSMQGKGGKAN
jgi:hypothetical protein